MEVITEHLPAEGACGFSALRPAVASAVALAFEPHPATHAGRVLGVVQSAGGRTVVELLRDAGIDPNATFYAWLNDRLLTADEWDTVCPQPGDVLSVKAAVQGGSGGSNPLKIVASIALAIIAPQIGLGLAAGVMGGEVAATTFLFGSITGAMIGTAVVSLAGNVLINALMPAPRAGLSQAAAKFTATSSPTYSLSGGSNRARPFEPLPLVMGVHRVFPDLAARPFTRYLNDQQVLFMLFDFGYGDLRIEDLRLGENPIGNFTGVQVYRSGGAASGVTQFAGNVDTAAGAPLTYNVAVTRTSAANALKLEIDLVVTAYAFDANGELGAKSVTIQMAYRLVGSGTWLNFWPAAGTVQTHYWSRGYSATERVETLDVDGNITYSNSAAQWHQVAHGTTTAGDHVEGDAGGSFTLPDGTTVATTWHWRPYSEIVDGSGVLKDAAPPRYPPAAGVATVTFTHARIEPLRLTGGRDVPEGQYEVRLTNLTPVPTSTQEAAAAEWVALRTAQPDTADYSGRNMIALRILATASLNGVVQQLSGLVSHSLPVKISGAWGRSFTRNPAWIFLALARGKRLSDYTGDAADAGMAWGAGLPDARIDLDGIVDWAAFCESAGLYCSLVIDRSVTVAEVLTTVARCGRASPTWANGTLGVVWDAPAQPIVAVFGMSNIIRDTFAVHYVSDKLTEEVVVQFVNPEQGWQQDTVRALVPGVTTPTRTTTVELLGCTSRDQAGREANLIAAAQHYRRRQIVWESDFEGLVVQRGDVVLLSHDLTQWSYTGRMAPGSSTLSIVLDRSVPRNGAVEYVGIRQPNGTFTVHNVTAGPVGTEMDSLSLQSALSYNPSADADGHPVQDYLWFFSPLATPGKKVKLTDVRPLSASRVRISATDEDPDYYTAEDGTYEHTAVAAATITPALVSLDVVESLVAYGKDWRPAAVVQWSSVNAVETRLRYKLDSSEWVAAGVFGATERFEITPVKTGAVVTVEVTPYGAGGTAGATLTDTLTVAATATPIPPALASATATGQVFGVALAWTWPTARQGIASVRILASTTNNIATASEIAAVVFPANAWVHTNLTKNQVWYYWLKVVDMLGRESAAVTASATVSASTTAILAQLSTAITTSELASSLSTPIAQNTTDVTNIKGLYSVKMDSGGTLSGFGLMSSLMTGGSPTSTFLVSADKFAVIAPAGAGYSSGDARSAPFVVLTSAQTINGVSFAAGVYINGGVISARTLVTLGVAEDAVSSIYSTEGGWERNYSATPYLASANVELDTRSASSAWASPSSATVIASVNAPAIIQSGDSQPVKFLLNAQVQVANTSGTTVLCILCAAAGPSSMALNDRLTLSDTPAVPRLANVRIDPGEVIWVNASRVISDANWSSSSGGAAVYPYKALGISKRSGETLNVFRTIFSVTPFRR